MTFEGSNTFPPLVVTCSLAQRVVAAVFLLAPAWMIVASVRLFLVAAAQPSFVGAGIAFVLLLVASLFLVALVTVLRFRVSVGDPGLDVRMLREVRIPWPEISAVRMHIRSDGKGRFRILEIRRNGAAKPIRIRSRGLREFDALAAAIRARVHEPEGPGERI